MGQQFIVPLPIVSQGNSSKWYQGKPEIQFLDFFNRVGIKPGTFLLAFRYAYRYTNDIRLHQGSLVSFEAGMSSVVQ